MTPAKFSDFFCSLVTYRNQLILFLSSDFWGDPPTEDVIHVYMEAPFCDLT